jgi:hypothetical protein
MLALSRSARGSFGNLIIGEVLLIVDNLLDHFADVRLPDLSLGTQTRRRVLQKLSSPNGEV